MKKRIADWYEGEWTPYDSEPYSSAVIIGGYYKRHWTARVARKLAEFWLAHWKWIIGTVLAVLAISTTIAKD